MTRADKAKPGDVTRDGSVVQKIYGTSGGITRMRTQTKNGREVIEEWASDTDINAPEPRSRWWRKGTS